MGEARRTPRQSAQGSDPSVLTARDSSSKTKSHHLPTGHFQGPFSWGKEGAITPESTGNVLYRRQERGRGCSQGDPGRRCQPANC